MTSQPGDENPAGCFIFEINIYENFKLLWYIILGIFDLEPREVFLLYTDVLRVYPQWLEEGELVLVPLVAGDHSDTV